MSNVMWGVAQRRHTRFLVTSLFIKVLRGENSIINLKSLTNAQIQKSELTFGFTKVKSTLRADSF